MKLISAIVLLVAVSAGGVTLRKPFERVASMDPMRASDTAAASAVSLVYEPLLEVCYMARPYRLRGLVCDLPEVGEDGLVYTFRVRESARFSNGRAVTAEDVKWSLERLADKTNASPGMWIMDGVKAVRAKDARTVEIELVKPLHIFKWLMAMPYAAVIAKEDMSGTGFFKLSSWRKNHEMVFTRVRRDVPPDTLEDGGLGNVDEVRYFVVDDVSTRWLMFLGGQLDYLGGISRDNWDAVIGRDGKLLPQLAAKGMTLYSAPSLSLYYLGFNMKDPVVGSNRKLRQALNCAFDFPAWRRFMNDRVAFPGGAVPPGVEGRLETPFPYAFDMEKAKRLLGEAGYAGGIDPKTGRRLHLEVSVGRATQDARESIELIAAFYARVGIELTARYMTWDAYLKAVNEGRSQIFFIGWIGDYPDPENFMQLFHSKNVSPGSNHGNYINPAFDRAYDACDWKTAQEIVREDCPFVFMHSPKTFSLAWNRLKGYKPSDFAYGTEKYLVIAPPEKDR